MSQAAEEVEQSADAAGQDSPRFLPNITHNRSGWRMGCRCGVCREDHRLESRERRAAKRQAKADEQAKAERTAKHYPTQVAVARQLDDLKAMENNPGVAAICLKMAAILDDPSATPQQPAAAGKLLEALRELGLKPRAASPALAEVRTMVNRPVPVPPPAPTAAAS
jgi:hypothetical protein